MLFVGGEFYVIKCLETIVRSILNTNFLMSYCGQDLRHVLYKKFFENGRLEKMYNKLTTKIHNQILKEKIKLRVQKKWIKLRPFKWITTTCEFILVYHAVNSTILLDNWFFFKKNGLKKRISMEGIEIALSD